MRKVYVPVRIPDQLLKKIDKYGKKPVISRSDVIRAALYEFFEHREAKHGEIIKKSA